MPTDGKKRPCEVDHLHIDTRLGDHEHRARAPTGRRAADGAGAFPTARRVPAVGAFPQSAAPARQPYGAAVNMSRPNVVVPGRWVSPRRPSLNISSMLASSE